MSTNFMDDADHATTIVEQLNVLYLEDNEDVGDGLTQALATLYAHWRIVWVKSLEQAQNCLKHSQIRFDAAIVDLGLPDASSDEAPMLLRAHHPNLPIVVLTGQRSDITADFLIREGIQEFLVKGHATPQQIARSIRSAVERQARQSDLEAAALRDHLTKALNRQGLSYFFDQTVRAADRKSLKVGAMVCDMNQFKQLNDTYGHAAGDAVLRHFVENVSSAYRPEDAIGRLGGDEFCVLTSGLKGIDEAELVANRLVQAAMRPCLLGDEQHPVSASFGLAVYPDHGTRLSELIERADEAMYKAKQNNETLAIAR